MKVLQILKDDHAELRKSVAELLEMKVGHEAVQKAEEFSRFLDEHQQIEEKFLYPPLEKAKATKDEVREGVQEHHVLNILIQELAYLNPKDKMWQPKLKVIKENLEHHLQEEETDLFPKISTSLDKTTLEDVLVQILKFRKKHHVE